MDEEESPLTSSPSSVNTKSALSEVLQHWQSRCLEAANETTATIVGSSQIINISQQQKQQQSKAEKLRVDSKAFFRYLVDNTKVVVEGNFNIVLATKSSHEEALAKLVQELGPALSNQSHESRLCALFVLIGALEGCGASSSGGSKISSPLCNLLGTFLLSHCGPIIVSDKDDGDYYSGEDLEEQIRDAAVLGLTALVAIPAAGDFILVNDKAEDDSKRNSLVQALRLRLSLSQNGVQRRCALPETEENNATGYGFGHNGTRNRAAATDLRGGLAALPRSKRSRCFDLVQSAVSAVMTNTNQVSSSCASMLPDSSLLNGSTGHELQPDLVAFATFTASCIQGESDPRCLLQLLQLIHAMQKAFEPWLVSSKDAASVFPTTDIFDAVAPYFPIQFTPPPNNIHGITREGLNGALIAVLCFVNMDENAAKHNRHTMLNLSAGLFLEQLFPGAGRDEDEGQDNQPSTHECLEVLKCLDTLLFPVQEENSSSTATTSGTTTSYCRMMEVNLVRNLSAALISIHHTSSLAVAESGDEGKKSKLLADTCRNLVSKIAFQLELCSADNSSLWIAFVAEPVEKQSGHMKASPSNSRTSIAYSACLAASGGSRTLRWCLQASLAPLIEFLSESKESLAQGSDNAAAAAHGVGAFFSSCRVAMDRAEKEGVALYPHPLQPYSAKAFQAICIILEDQMEVEPAEESPMLPLPVKVAAVRALDCLLLASTSEQLPSEEDHKKVCELIESLSKSIITGTVSDEESLEWKKACGRTVGSILGHCINRNNDRTADDSDGAKDTGILAVDLIRKCLKQVVYPTLAASATSRNESDSSRFDRVSLALACSCGRRVADFIVSSLLQTLSDTFERKQERAASIFSAAATLSFVLAKGGEFAIEAYHDIGPPYASHEEIVEKLSTMVGDNSKMDARASVANLQLPHTPEAREAMTAAGRVAYKLVLNLLPAFSTSVPMPKLKTMIKGVSDLMPPLSDADNLRMILMLPLLAASLHADVIVRPDPEAMDTDEDSIETLLLSLLEGLVDYALSSDQQSESRSTAASCLHAAMTKIGRTLGCPAAPLLHKSIYPALRTAFEDFVKSPDQLAGASIRDILIVLSTVGSAAACRGGNSSQTSDKVAMILVQLACEGKSSIPSDKAIHPVELSFLSSELAANEAIEVAAGSAYGSMLYAEAYPLMKQRLTHVALKIIRAAYEEEHTRVQRGETGTRGFPRVGLLVIASHIVCSSDVSKLDKKTLHQLSVIALEGLSSRVFPVDESPNLKFATVRKLVLSSILKLICVAPTSISAKSAVVKGLLRAYSSTHPVSEVSSKLLALQALEGVALLDGSNQAVNAIKPAVVSILAAAMNHPSGLLRQAGVDVRNAWYIMD